MWFTKARSTGVGGLGVGDNAHCVLVILQTSGDCVANSSAGWQQWVGSNGGGGGGLSWPELSREG